MTRFGNAMTSIGWLTLPLAGGLLVVFTGRTVIVLTLLAALCVLASRRGRVAQLRPPGFKAAHVAALGAAYCVMASTLVWRVRSSAEIASQPLDSAGAVRVLLDVAALVLAVVAIMGSDDAKVGWPVSLKGYAAYVAVIPLGAVVALRPALVLFRFVELLVAVVTVTAVRRAFAGDMRVPLQHLYRFLWGLVFSLGIGVLIWPNEALRRARGGIVPFRLQGVLPVLSANMVGTIGLLLFVAALAWSAVRRPGAWATVGLALIGLAQYRTGYVGAAVAFAAWLFFRRGVSGKATLAIAGLAVALFVQTGSFHDAWYRGESEAGVATLNSRTTWWSAAFQATERSPIVGLGLTSGTRYEVFTRLSRDTTSTLHGCWVEAYAGTGILGTLLLLFAVSSAVPGTVRLASRGSPFLMLLLLVLTIRSIDGSSFELPGLTLLFFLFTAAAASNRAVERSAERASVAA